MRNEPAALNPQIAPVQGFDEALHLYTIGGRVIPSVTQILKDAGIIEFGKEGSELENTAAMARGKAVHAACHYLDEGDLDWSTVTDEALPYVLAYEKFKADTEFKPMRIEERLFNNAMGYAGTIDREGTLKGDKAHVVLEIKTGDPASFWALQLAGYDSLLPTLSLRRKRVAVQLRNNGEYGLHHFANFGDRDLFLSLVALYWWKRNNA